MSNPDNPQDENEGKDQGTENQGPNLVLIYVLMAIGFLIAVAFAAAIVFPFYRRR